MSDLIHGWTYYGKGPDGVEMALSLPIDPALSATDIAKQLGAFHAALHTAGFRRSDRLDKPVGGWGGGGGKQQRPETPCPAGIVRPEHCGQPMKYIVYKKDGAKGHEGRGVPPDKADMWVCAKDKQCEDVTSGKSERAAANFDMKPEKAAQPAQDGAQASKPPLAERLGAEPATMGYGDFLNAAMKLGYARAGCIQFAGFKTADELQGIGSDGWLDLLSKMRSEKAVTA